MDVFEVIKWGAVNRSASAFKNETVYVYQIIVVLMECVDG